MATALNTSNTSSSQLDQLVLAYKNTFKPQVDRLTTKKTALEKSSNFYNGLNSRTNSIISQIDRFDSSTIRDDLSKKRVTSSASDYVTATGNASSVDGVNTIRVNRLAVQDFLISDKVNQDSEFGISAGEHKIEFIVDGETKEVSFELTGEETNKEAIKKIITAINKADIGLAAGSVQETSSSTRLTLRSAGTGEDNQIKFNDSNVLRKLGLDSSLFGKSVDSDKVNDDDDQNDSDNDENTNVTSRVIAKNSKAGFKVSDPSGLNSLATINGLEVTRSSNTLEDAIDGLTINLLKVQDTEDPEVTLDTAANAKDIQDIIQPLLDSFNNLIRYVNSDREQLRTDPAVRNLRNQFRILPTTRVPAGTEGDPEYLSNFGINAATDGTLSLSKIDDLQEILDENPEAILNFFLADNGFVANIKDAVNRLRGDDGDLIKDKTLDLAKQIDDQKKRISDLEARIDRQGESQRKQYTASLDALYKAQGQYSSFSAFASSQGF